MPFKCCVPLCNFKNGTKLHQFPQDHELFKTWCKAIEREALCEKGIILVRKYYRVCDIHFDEDAKFIQHHNRTNLKVGSVPTLHLPDIKFNSPPNQLITEVHNSDVIMNVPSTSSGINVFNEGNVDKVLVSNSKTTKMKGTALMKRRNFLLEVNLRRKAELTPKAAKLYQIANEYRDIAKKLNDEAKSNHGRVKEATKFMESGQVYQHKINATTFKFLQSQISQQHKRPKGRRFNLDDKILSLALLKQSPKGYRLLKKIFALPSRKTLMSLLKKIPFGCGINKPVLESLRQSVKNLKPRDRHCIVMFDEMSLQPLLQYNKSGQFIDGFQDISPENPSKKIADHAIVFMVKGLASKWKQPIAYFFSQNGMSNPEIAKNLKEIISHLLDIGLKVVATVCDQYNKSAINMLVEETKRDSARMGHQHASYSFKLAGEEIFPLYDFPHLLKGLRNNLLTHDVRFTWKNGEETASWKHIEDLYDLDSGEDDFRMLERLTDEHVKKNKIKKMKVKHAAQVFSHRVSSTMRGLITHGSNALPPEAMGTANFLLFGDKLFDSVNGSCVDPKDRKVLRRAVTSKTEHIRFWDEAVEVLRTVKYVSNGKEFVPPTITNWIVSLKNLKLIWNKLQTEGFEFLCTRNLNQDPLENFFSCIRSHGVRNINPSCSAFRAAFKSLIINNYMTSHSAGANCEEDDSEGALNNLKHFLESDVIQRTEGLLPLDYADDYVLQLKPPSGEHVLKVHGYIAGYMAKTILRSIGICATCRKELISTEEADEHALIRFREYKPNALLRPRTKFVVLFGFCSQVLRHFLPKICDQSNLKNKLLLIAMKNISSGIFNVCEKHNLFKMFLNFFVDFYCFTWVSNVNRILKGSITQNVSDAIKQQAAKLYMKYRSRCNKVRQQKQLQS